MKEILIFLMISTVSFSLIVNPIENLKEDFIFGMDVSMLYEIEKNGGKYFDENVEKQCLNILKEHGVNWIRLRVWNDPKDENGNPLGGGNCNYENMTEIAKKAKNLGLKVFLDFHYSDWWADPGKQNKPKAWINLHGKELENAVYDYTKFVLTYMKNNNALPEMVQIGNEVNNGFLWPDGMIFGKNAGGFEGFTKLLNAAIKAIREIDPSIKIVIHLAEGGNTKLFKEFFGELINRNIDFDIIGVSYYPYWHGTFEDLKKTIFLVSKKYKKDIIIAETGYAWTANNGDNHPNLFSKGMELSGGYLATIQGQTTFLRDLIELVNNVPDNRGLGIFYWEGEWIPIKGAGWKTGEGNPWDNQTLFDFNGNALPSLDIMNLIKTSPATEVKMLKIYPVELTYNLGEEIDLPKTIKALFSDDSIRSLPVTWNLNPEISEIPGVHKIEGIIKSTKEKISATVTIKNTRNFLKNPSFETGEFAPWIVLKDINAVKIEKANPPDNAHNGEYAVNFWLDSPFSFVLYQELEISNGKYKVGFWTHGNAGVKVIMKVSEYGGEDRYVEIEESGWLNWHNPIIDGINVSTGKIKISIIVEGKEGDWGFLDDFYLFKVDE